MTLPPTPRAGIQDILDSVGAALGVPGHADRLGLPEASRYVVMLVDGMGETLLREHAELAPFLSSLPAVPDVFSAVPSTTSVNLTSLGTGELPGVHGMSGYTCRIPGTTEILNTLRWDERIDPEEWQPHPTVLSALFEAGVNVTAVNDIDFEFSGLTRCSQRGVPYVGVKHAWERLLAVSDAAAQGAQSVVYTYESGLDFAGHAHGVDSDDWRDALGVIDRDLQELRESLPDDTVLLVTADHGMVDVPMSDRFDVIDHPELLDNLVVFAGEARFRHLHTRSGREEDVAARWREVLGDRAHVRLRQDTEEWFGPLSAHVAARFGDVIIAAREDFGVFHSEQQSIELLMRGFHGSVTERERRIPLLIAA